MAFARQTRKNKVFVDSSVLISAAISSKGSSRDLIIGGFRSEFKLYISDLVIEETRRNLLKKSPKSVPFFEIVRQIFPARAIIPTKSEVLRAAKTVNLKDAPIIAAAVKAGVGHLVSFDRELLNQRDEIKTNFGILVATPKKILRQQK